MRAAPPRPYLYPEEPADIEQLAGHGWTCACGVCESARDRFLAHKVLPRRRVGLAAAAVLPVEIDLPRLQQRMRLLAPHGWSTDLGAIERVLAGLRERLAADE